MHEHDAFIGQVVGGHRRTTRLLGAGGSGAVYEVQNSRLNRQEALKLIPVRGSERHGVETDLGKEIQATVELEGCRHIVAVYDVDEWDSRLGTFLWYAMQLAPGETLRELLRREKRLPWRRVVGLLDQLSRALEYAHGRGVLHRDLKPANVMVAQLRNGDDHVTVLDFGIAILPHDRLPDQRESEHLVLRGTPLYAPPDGLNGLPPDPRGDLYSLGLVAFESLTGHVPFQDADEALAILIRRLLEPPPELRDVLPGLGIPDGLSALVRRLLSPDRGDRPQSASEVRKALALLERAPDGEGEVLPPPSPRVADTSLLGGSAPLAGEWRIRVTDPEAPEHTVLLDVVRFFDYGVFLTANEGLEGRWHREHERELVLTFTHQRGAPLSAYVVAIRGVESDGARLLGRTDDGLRVELVQDS